MDRCLSVQYPASTSRPCLETTPPTLETPGWAGGTLGLGLASLTHTGAGGAEKPGARQSILDGDSSDT